VASEDEFEPCVEEMRIEDLLMTMMERAKDGLRGKSIDEFNALMEYCREIPSQHRHLVPPEVVQFLVGFRRKRGRMRSQRAAGDRFWRDPNRVAALLAANHVEELRKKHGGRYKITLSDGSKDTVHAIAARWAKEFVDRSFEKVGTRRVNEDQVMRLLNKGKARVAKPWDPFDDDPNPD
jgi:hypothetical protein